MTHRWAKALLPRHPNLGDSAAHLARQGPPELKRYQIDFLIDFSLRAILGIYRVSLAKCLLSLLLDLLQGLVPIGNHLVNPP